MTVGEAIKKSVFEHKPVIAGRVADLLRFKFGYNYEQVYELAHKLTGVSQARWETLMYESDIEESA